MAKQHERKKHLCIRCQSDSDFFPVTLRVKRYTHDSYDREYALKNVR